MNQVRVLLMVFLIAAALQAQVDPMSHVTSAIKSAEKHEFEAAVMHMTKALKDGVSNPEVYYHRGRWNFCAGRSKASLQDFDAYLKEVPERSKSLWERGISCYYAGDFKAGAEQFVEYQTYHDSDVENAVWRYLCQLHVDGKEQARKAMLPIKGDRRVPMMEVYRLFRGEAEPDEVLKALAASRSTDERKKMQAMHAHLYLGLYFDSERQPEKAKMHIDESVKQFDKGSYMWSVAVVHQRHLKKEPQPSQPAQK